MTRTHYAYQTSEDGFCEYSTRAAAVRNARAASRREGRAVEVRTVRAHGDGSISDGRAVCVVGRDLSPGEPGYWRD